MNHKLDDKILRQFHWLHQHMSAQDYMRWKSSQGDQPVGLAWATKLESYTKFPASWKGKRTLVSNRLRANAQIKRGPCHYLQSCYQLYKNGYILRLLSVTGVNTFLKINPGYVVLEKAPTRDGDGHVLLGQKLETSICSIRGQDQG